MNLFSSTTFNPLNRVKIPNIYIYHLRKDHIKGDTGIGTHSS